MANEIASARKEMGLSRTEFGNALGVVRTTVMRWEKGEAIPGEPALRLVRELLERHRKQSKRSTSKTHQASA